MSSFAVLSVPSRSRLRSAGPDAVSHSSEQGSGSYSEWNGVEKHNKLNNDSLAQSGNIIRRSRSSRLRRAKISGNFSDL
jgi:hypothetical protein